MRNSNVPRVRHVRRSHNQTDILRALAESAEPLKSSELTSRSGLFQPEMRAACRRLKADGYIQSTMKREVLLVGNSRAMKPLAYWSLTEKGRAYFQASSG